MRLKRILVLIILTMFFCTICVFAAEPQITLEGEQTAKTNETKILTIKISSETEIGVVSGKIETNENIININVTGKNDWNLTFNKDTGVFNIYKAEGAKTEEIISIEYTTANKEGTGRITLSNLKMTTIEYETKEVSNVVKDITIKNETLEPEPTPNPTVAILTNIKITKAPTRTTYTEGEKFDKTGMIVTAEYSDGTSKEITNYTYTPSEALKTTDEKVTISYTEGEVTKKVNQDITVINVPENNTEDNKEGTKGDSVTPDKEIPKAGVEKNIILVIGVVLIVTMASYLGYKKYKNI